MRHYLQNSSIEQCSHPYCIIHMRTHITLQGSFMEGSARAGQLANITLQVPVTNTLSQARLSHQFFHQEANLLSRQFVIPITEAKLIFQTCPDCQQQSGPLTTINPRGLSSLRILQIDITNIPEFGRLKYIHESFSHAIWATAMAGETSHHVQAHFHAAVATPDIPKERKTHNGPAYVSHSTTSFFHPLGITHKTGMPHSPTVQAAVEQVHRTAKNLLAKKKGRLKRHHRID